ncbi:hypothetical protein EVAR_46139_1 [Eumeta japonica]|uniref:Uncharacterized protein n=1 Tax=Eumeta variegata TaxID=151549 RepID=A0A4C1XRK5_EUMVA|nr:hypothetical protein EVAR_46139_1 [Eumeta japonica]
MIRKPPTALEADITASVNNNYRLMAVQRIRQRSSGGARRRRPPTASRLKGPREQKSFIYKLLKRDLANLMSPTSTSGLAPPLQRSGCSN